ncbi:MAG: hypothetical protein H6851_05220 [Geminicoccaceae bacterium]|nr:hypothetical protein [Geminicoccaceae bacterium]
MSSVKREIRSTLRAGLIRLVIETRPTVIQLAASCADVLFDHLRGRIVRRLR